MVSMQHKHIYIDINTELSTLFFRGLLISVNKHTCEIKYPCLEKHFWISGWVNIQRSALILPSDCMTIRKRRLSISQLLLIQKEIH